MTTWNKMAAYDDVKRCSKTCNQTIYKLYNIVTYLKKLTSNRGKTIGQVITRYYWTDPVSWNVIRKTRQQNSRICDSSLINCNNICLTLFGTPFLDPFWAKWLFTYLFYPLYGPKLCCHVAVANLCKCISMLYWPNTSVKHKVTHGTVGLHVTFRWNTVQT